MTLAKDERIFLVILLVNLVVALCYLLTGVLFLVPAHKAADREEGEEIPYDNRRTYLLRFVVMILCPVIGPLFFFMGHVVYLPSYGCGHAPFRRSHLPGPRHGHMSAGIPHAP